MQQHGQPSPRAIGRCNGIHIWWAALMSSIALLPASSKYICTAAVGYPTKHLCSFICCKSMQCPNTNKCLEQQWCQSSVRSNGIHSFPQHWAGPECSYRIVHIGPEAVLSALVVNTQHSLNYELILGENKAKKEEGQDITFVGENLHIKLAVDSVWKPWFWKHSSG